MVPTPSPNYFKNTDLPPPPSWKILKETLPNIAGHVCVELNFVVFCFSEIQQIPYSIFQWGGGGGGVNFRGFCG